MSDENHPEQSISDNTRAFPIMEKPDDVSEYIRTLKAQVEAEKIRNNRLQADIETIAINFHRIMKLLGFIQPDGSIKMNARAAMSSISRMLTGGMREELAFLEELRPLLERYKYIVDRYEKRQITTNQ